MDQDKDNSEEKENKESSLTKSACKEFKMFLDHINSVKPSLLRNQLSELLFPLYVHLFLLKLQENNCSKYAQEFLKTFQFVAITKPLEFSIMKSFSTYQEVVTHLQFNSYKIGRKISIKYTESNYNHLQKWLQFNQPYLISKLLRENFHPEILKEKLGKADPLIPPANTKDIPHNRGITYERCEESFQEESDSEISDVSSVRNGNEAFLQDLSDVDDVSDSSSITSEKLLDIENTIESSDDSSDESDVDTSSFESESDSSGNEESNNLNVKEISFKTSTTIEDSKRDTGELYISNDVIPTRSYITNGLETPEGEEVDTYDLSTEAVIANGVISPDSDEFNGMEIESTTHKAAVANGIESLNCKDSMETNSINGGFTLAKGTEVLKTENTNSMATGVLPTSVTSVNGETSSWHLNPKECMVTLGNCTVLLHRVDEIREVSNTLANLDLIPSISSPGFLPSFNKRSVSHRENDTKEMESEKIKGEVFPQNITMKENFALRECKVFLKRISANNYLPTPSISSSSKRKNSAFASSISISEDFQFDGKAYSNNSTKMENHVTKRLCTVSVNKTDDIAKVFNDDSSNSNQQLHVSSHSLPYSFACSKMRPWDKGANYSQNSTMKEKFIINECRVIVPRMDLSKISNCSSDLKLVPFTSTSRFPTSSEHINLSGRNVKITEIKDTVDNLETVSQSEGASTLSITSLNESRDEYEELLDEDSSRIKQGKRKCRLCAPCLLKKKFGSTPGQRIITGNPKIVTDNITKSVIEAIYLTNKKVPFENRLTEKGCCFSSVIENFELERVLQKFRAHSSEWPYLQTEVPPIRVLNIKAREKLQCSVIAKDLSYIACAFEKSVYIWKSMDKLPNKYFLSSNPIKLYTRNTFVPTKERIGGVSAFSEKPYSGSLHCLACNPITNQFLLGSESTIECWCPIMNKCLLEYKFHTDVVNDMCFRPNSPDFISTSMDKTAVVWDFETSIPKCQYSHNEAVKLSSVHPKLPYVVTATSREIHMWIDGSPVSQCVFAGHQANINDIAFSPSGDNLVSCDKSGLVNVWNLNKRQKSNSFLVTKQGVGKLCYNSSEKNVVLATTGLDNTLRLYSSETPINNAQERIPIFTAECEESSELSSVHFSGADELIEITYTPKRPFEEYPKSVS